MPGGGHVMVNIGTGNVLLQEDDMEVAHKGIALAYRRTYNLQSGHDVNGSDGSWPTVQGNGWTSTWDAHLSGDPTHAITVWDIDGAKYTYTLAGDGKTWLAPPGQHATLASDGACGVLWTKKSGTTYDFYALNGTSTCTNSVPLYGGYGGRLYTIFGRNQNTALSFIYTWDNGNAGPTGKIANITARTESGMQATLVLADFNGHRLAQSLSRPDGIAIYYQYDGNGNLTAVGEPPNSTSTASVWHSFGYGNASNGAPYLVWAGSPRWAASGSTDGSYLYFGVQPVGTGLALGSIGHVGWINPTIGDGTTSGYVQPSGPTGVVQFLFESYTSGTLGTASTPTYRDSDGHYTNWVTDALGRPTQTQECTATQNQQCTGTLLVSGESWDASDDLVAEVDARGYETDYAYDANGNTVAVGAPTTTVQTPNGTVSMRPTKLFDYDGFNNMVAYCDERETHQANADWQGPSSSDSLCSLHAGQAGHDRFGYAYPSYEPFGERTSATTSLGYQRTFAYAAGPQQGADYGLPTAASGQTITQADSSQAAENETFGYDANGNATTYGTGSGTWQLTYDSLGRLTVATDPDGVSSYRSYWPDGSLSKTETAAQHASQLGVQLTRDLDGNVTQEMHHYTCTSAQNCTAGTTQKWYDGADRLVEVAMPQDPSDRYPFPWLTRYIYDLTQGGTVSVFGRAVRAYGGLAKTQQWLANPTPVWTEPGWSSMNAPPPPALGAPAWTAVSGSAFDALDRTVSEYRETLTRSNTYDTPSNTPGSPSNALGLLAQTCNGASECASLQYDERANVAQETFSTSSSPAQQFVYDENSRTVAASSAGGSVTMAYDGDGRETRRSQTVALTGRSASIAYHYYADGKRSSLDISTPAVTASGALAYSYRSDGKLTTLAYGYTVPATWKFAYTGAGRLSQRSDTVNATPTTITYDPAGTGRPTGMTYPAGSNASLQYDAEGELTGGMLSGRPYTNAYTLRGELLASTLTGTVKTSYGLANGAMVPIAQSSAGTYWKPYTYSIDAIRGVPIGNHAINTCPQGSTSCGTDSGGDVSSDTQYTYDAAARQAGSIRTGPQSIETGNVPRGTVAKHYDAEDHLLEQDFVDMPGFGAKFPQSWSLGYAYGPEGHPLAVGTTSHVSTGATPTDFQYDSLFWDDDAMLFSQDAQGNIDDVKIGTLGDFQAHGTLASGQTGPLLSVIDRDAKGQTIGCHASDGTVSAPNGYAWVFGGDGPVCVTSTGTIGRGGVLTMPRTDGLLDGWNTIQGVRSYDTQAGVWNTPDAYHGDVHDPISQQPYVWNGNNPYDYSDPSGYDPCLAHQAWDGENCVASSAPLLEIGRTLAKPYLPPAAAAAALERFNAPGSAARFHAPNFIATGTALWFRNPVEVHHWLPKAFQKFFAGREIDIEQYTTNLSFREHRAAGSSLHARGYNAEWDRWTRSNPRASARDVIDQLNVMAHDFGVFFENPF